MKHSIRELSEKKAFVELRGRSTVFIEGFEALLRYEEDEMRFRICGQILYVRGSRLTLSYLSETRIAVSGKIDCVGYLDA